MLRSLGTTIDHVAKQKAIALIDAVQNDDQLAKSDIAKLLPRKAKQYAIRFRQLMAIAEPCVYVLLGKRKILYVGQAQCLLNRLSRHPWLLLCDEILYLPASVDELDKIESELIKLLKPSLNKTKGRSRNKKL